MKRKIRKVFMSLVAFMSIFTTTSFADMITYSSEEHIGIAILLIAGLLFNGLIVIGIVAVAVLIIIKCVSKREKEKQQGETSEIDRMF